MYIKNIAYAYVYIHIYIYTIGYVNKALRALQSHPGHGFHNTLIYVRPALDQMKRHQFDIGSTIGSESYILHMYITLNK